MIDTNTALSSAAREANERTFHEAEANNWRAAFIQAMTDSWGRDDGAAVEFRNHVFTTIRSTPEHVLRPLWREVLLTDPTVLWQRCPIPARYIRSRRQTDLATLRALNPNITTVDLKPHCNGHWPHLQRPDLLNPLIESFAAGTHPADR